MSKRRDLLAIIICCLTVLAGTSVIWARGYGQAAGTARTQAMSSQAVAEMTSEIVREVGTLRELKPLGEIKSGAKSRDAIRDMVLRNFDEDYTPGEMDAEFKALVAFGLVPRTFDYRGNMVSLLTEQIAGFYDPRRKELFLADWNPLDSQKPVMVHELTHALQDQHFDLKRFEKWPKGDSDRELAIHALIEGDATAVMMEYLLKQMGSGITRLPQSALDKLSSQMNGGSGMKEFDNAPRCIRESLVFPYLAGLKFVAEILRNDGWKGVSAAYKTLPQSTEQILHYGKFLKQEMPVKVSIADLLPQLGKNWKLLEKNISGEYFYYLALSEFIDKETARVAAEGWGGDQAAVYENPANGDIVLSHVSVWDSEADAREFFAAYAARTGAMYKSAEVKETGPDARTYSYDGKLIYLERRGSEVIVLEGIRSAGKLVERLWTSRIG